MCIPQIVNNREIVPRMCLATGVIASYEYRPPQETVNDHLISDRDIRNHVRGSCCVGNCQCCSISYNALDDIAPCSYVVCRTRRICCCCEPRRDCNHLGVGG